MIGGEDVKINLYVEFDGEKTETKTLENAFREIWKERGGKLKDLEDVELYYKPDEKACYYFIPQNGESGKIAV